LGRCEDVNIYVLPFGEVESIHTCVLLITYQQ